MSTNTTGCRCETCGRSPEAHEGCTACLPASAWEIRIAWALRTVLAVTVILLISQGAWLYATVCVVSVLLVAFPAAVARTSKANLPVELELILLWFLVSDNTLGRLVELYDTTSWFDKVLHFGNSLGIGFAGFLVVYVLLFTGRVRPSPIFTAVLILLVTLGIGALWEILEYGLDLALQQGAQGSPRMTPLDDTMWDLILDGAGGVLGAILGPLYIERSNRSRCRFSAFAHYFLLRRA
ncbi:MAG: hypothetical protein GTO41_17115 [Burkholderiales bacterium]|nr:hypothetical protein [Burkholderiales bacterium]